MTIHEQKPVKVCFVSPKAYPLFNPDCNGAFGGAEVDLCLLSTELAKDQNFHVAFITADMLNYDYVQHLMTDHLNKKADNARLLWLIFIFNKWRHHVT